MAFGATFENFINTLIKDGEINILFIRDKPFKTYISVNGILRFIQQESIYNAGNDPILKINLDDKPFYSLSTQISSNLNSCYIRNSTLGLYPGLLNPFLFRSVFEFSGDNASKFNLLNSSLTPNSNTIDSAETYVYPQVGNINNIYVELDFLSTLMIKEPQNNTDNSISIYRFLQTVCDEMTRSLGCINDFQPYIDEEENELTIVDFNQGRIPGLVTEEATNINISGLGSFITDLKVESSITPDMASLISIGAQANANVLGEEATTFSRLSQGLTDRIQPIKEFPTGSLRYRPSIDNSTENALKDNVKAYKELISKQQGFQQDVLIIDLTDEDFNNTNLGTDINKYYVGFFTDKEQTNPTFIPIKLSLDMLGISGIKIFQKFKTNSLVLPYDYRNNYEFLITEVSHDIDNSNYWNTSIGALIKLKEKDFKQVTIDPIILGDTVVSNEIALNTTSNINPSSQNSPSPTPPVNNVPSGTCKTRFLADSANFSPSISSNAASVKAMNSAFIKAFNNFDTVTNTSTGMKGMCGRGVQGLAYNYIEYLKNPNPSNLFERSNQGMAQDLGHAKQKPFNGSLTNLGYQAVLIGEGLKKTEIIDVIDKKMKFNPGDILVYWSEDSKGREGEFGHAQVFIEKGKWSSNDKENYNTSFVYASDTKPSNCWTIYVMRAPQK